MRRGVRILVATALLACSSSTLAQSPASGSKPRIAVLNVISADRVFTDAELDVLTEDLRQETSDALHVWFDLITRENLDVLLRESGTDLDKCFKEGQCEVDVGRNIHADVVISSQATRAGRNIVLRVSAHQTKTGAVIKKASAEGKDIDELRAQTRGVVRKVLTEVANVVPHGAGPAFQGQAIGSRPEAWAPPEEQTVLVVFSSTPSGAVVTMDDKLVCQETECSKNVAAGTHIVKMQKERWLDRIETVAFEASTRRLSWKLDPDFGWVTVLSDPPGLSVRVDGREIGRTPVNEREIPPGVHDVVVTDPKYYEVGERVQVERGQQKRLNLSPTPRQGAVKVTAVDGKRNAIVGEVSIGGQRMGNTPGKWTMLVGEYDVVVKSRVGVWKGTVTIQEKRVAEIEAVTREAFAGQCKRVDDARGGEMCFVPAGSFVAGCANGRGMTCVKGEENEHRPSTQAYWIDRTEVSVADYAECLNDGSCSAPTPGDQCNWAKAGRRSHPINCVGFSQAQAYCRWAGKRLPTENEWEKAARGEEGRTFPWGNQAPTCRTAIMDQGGQGCGKASTAEVGSHPAGNSPYNVADLAGNVWEWVGSGSPILRGGSWVDAPGLMRSSLRLVDVPARGFANTGFRCAKDNPATTDF